MKKILQTCMALLLISLTVLGNIPLHAATEDVEIPVAHADYNGAFKGSPVGAPENMYDDDPDSCAGEGYRSDLYFDFFFEDEAELNYLYLEKKKEGATDDPGGTFGTYGLYVPDGTNGDGSVKFKKLPDTVPVFSYDASGGGGYLIKLSQTVKTERLRVMFDAWYGKDTCWAGISTFRAWSALKTHTVTFRRDGMEDVTCLVRDGGTLAPSKFPAIPEKQGYHAAWSPRTLGTITQDVTLEAVYTAIAPIYKIGDISGDGRVNVKDASRLLRHLAGESGKVFAAPDVNNSGKADIQDVNTLLALLQNNRTVTISEEALYDKLVGGWIGQMVGVTWAAPTEFTCAGRLMDASAMPAWTPQTINNAFTQDDLYVEIPFLDAMKEKGVDCDGTPLAEKFRDSTFALWHANGMGRANLQSGIPYPESGHYLNNYHAEDIDWQIECDFLGMMYPGLVNEAAARAFELGHIMNYGDGVYGGVFVSAMHAAAFTAGSLEEIWQAGIEAIPRGTAFRALLDDVVASWRAGDSFEENWGKIQQKWGDTDICEELPGLSNIDAKLNSGYVLLGLLYGEGDFAKTILLSTRCGQDSDCNPSTAASILGSFYGASALPKIYTSGLDKTGQKFSFTNYTFNDALDLNFSLMKKVLEKYDGEKAGENWRYSITSVAIPAPFEQIPDGVYVYVAPLTVSGNAVVFHEVTPFCKNDGVTGITVSMGDGSVFADAIPGRYTYEKAGEYTVTFRVEGEKGENQVMRKITVGEGTAADATPICSVTRPMGGGAKDIGVICDGVIPDKNGSDAQQYDTYMLKDPNGNPDTAVYIGYVYRTARQVSGVVFTEGKHFGNGGWFKDGEIWIEALQNGKWTKLETTLDKAYPKSNTQSAFGDAFESYTFTLSSAVQCDGVRLAGIAGGSASFISVGELTILPA